MPRLTDTRVPSYRFHRPSGQAVVTLDGRDVYLGTHGSAASKSKYNRLTGEWLAAGRRLPADPQATTIAEIVALFRQHAKTYYRRPDGTNTSEIYAFDAAVAPLLKMYGKTPAAEFGPIRLETVRQQMIRLQWARTSINKHTSRIRHIFKWAASREMIDVTVADRLKTLAGLEVGRSEATEPDPVKPVAIEHVEAVYPFVSRQVEGMIRLQLITGMRSGEVVIMRTGDIDRSGKLWVYRPQHHKTLYRGHTREIYLGPKAQEVVNQFLKLDPKAFIFDPRDAEQDRRDRQHAARKTPAGMGNEPGTNRRRKPARQIGDRYDVASYRRAITRACDKANAQRKTESADESEVRAVPHWHPHRLRHTAATALRKTHGIEAAQVILGHKTLDVTELYAEQNVEQAMRIMAQVG
jgi:integrase